MTKASIKTIWGLAKSPELGLDEENLYGLVYRETGKDSLRKLSQREINTVCKALVVLKGGTPSGGQRTDQKGNTATRQLRQKVYKLTGELGWNDNNQRINGFAKKMFGVERIEWLEYGQCMKLIEILKKMVERKEPEHEKV